MFWEAFSFAVGFVVTFLFVRKKPMTMLIAIALAAAMFFLLGPLGIIGYAMALVVRLTLPGTPVSLHANAKSAHARHKK